MSAVSSYFSSFWSSPESDSQLNSLATYSNTSKRLQSLSEIYTGTENQPDVVSIFVKLDGSDISLQNEHIVNSLGHIPFSFMNAVDRIIRSGEVLFQELKQRALLSKNSESWNAIKNLFRGIIQLIPFLGNAALYGYDWARIHLFIQPQIKSMLSKEEENVVGLAFDGKVIFKVPVSFLYSGKSRSTEGTLALAHYTWLSMLKNSCNSKSKHNRLEIAELMRRYLINKNTSTLYNFISNSRQRIFNLLAMR